jgi:hypothetical protein
MVQCSVPRPADYNVFEIRALPYRERDVAAQQGEHIGSGT